MARRALTFLLIIYGGFALAGHGQASDASSSNPVVTDESGFDWNDIKLLDLDAVKRLAITGNYSLAAVKARVDRAQQLLAQAKANYFPRIDLKATVAHTHLSRDSYRNALATAQVFQPNATVDDPEDYYTGGINATWILFDGFKRRFENSLAEYGLEASRNLHEDAKRQLLSLVGISYYNAQLALGNIAIAEADKQFNQRQLKEAIARRQVGTGSLSDEYNFQIRVNLAEAELISAKESYDVALIGLASLLGLSSGKFPPHISLAPLKEEHPDELRTPDSTVLVNYAMKHRPDLFARKHAVNEGESRRQIVRASFFPTVSLLASIDGTRTNNGRFEQDDFCNTIGLNLTYNLFGGGVDRARLDEAKARQMELKKELLESKTAIAAEVQKAVASVCANQRQVLLQRSNADLVQQTRDLVEKEYVAGQGSLVRLNEAQKDLVAAQSRLALALVSLRQSWLVLAATTGDNLIIKTLPSNR